MSRSDIIKNARSNLSAAHSTHQSLSHTLNTFFSEPELSDDNIQLLEQARNQAILIYGLLNSSIADLREIEK